MKTTVIFHSADFDGLFCREIARKFLPEAELVGWDFGDEPLKVPEGKIYILDLPVDEVFGCDFKTMSDVEHWGWYNEITWIDHHKSSIETHPVDIPGYRIDGVAACRLAWQYLKEKDPKWVSELNGFPTKQDFIERKVSEPLAVRLAGEYDIWDRRDPNAELFQHGLRSRDLAPEIWMRLLGDGVDPKDDEMVLDLLNAGEVLQYAKAKENESVITKQGFIVPWQGLTFLACNHARYNSQLFSAGVKPEHDALLGFNWDGNQWRVSLYHAPGKEHHDLSLIAKANGGGGHRGACGFVCKTLPFDIGHVPF